MISSPTPTPTPGLNVIINQIDASRCSEIKSIITVTDEPGSPVRELSVSNIIITEDNINKSPISVKPVSSLLYFPASIALTMDYSDSMNGQPLIDVQNATAAFVTRMGVSDQGEIIKFSSEVSVVQPFVNDKTLLDKVAKSSWIGTGGNTALYDSIYQAVADTARQGGRMAVIAMTDSHDGASSHGLDELINFAKQSGVPVFTVELGSFDENGLKRIANETGGAYYYAHTSSDLQAIYLKLSEIINHQYVMAHNTVHSDGLAHTMAIKATKNEASGKASKEYTACGIYIDACTAVLSSSNFKFHIPLIEYQTLVSVSYIWLDMQYIQSTDGNVLMRMTAGDWITANTTCVPALLTSNLDLDIYDMIFYDISLGPAHYLAAFSYFPTSDGNIWFKMTNAEKK